MNSQKWFYLKTLTRQGWLTVRLAARKFVQIDGAQWAASFAFHAIFSLVPLMVLLITLATIFVDRDRAATEVIAYIKTYVPVSGDMQGNIVDTIAGVIDARAKAGTAAFFILNWVALQLFSTLVSATNRAWGVKAYSWWQRPLKSLLLLWITAGVVLFSTGASILVQMASDWLLLPFSVYALGSFVIPLVVVFFGLSLFYWLAPRRRTRFSEVWVAALGATGLLLLAEGLFVLYLKHFATLNAVYGVFGGIMALLLWIYLSGAIFIFGACLCAAQKDVSRIGNGNRG